MQNGNFQSTSFFASHYATYSEVDSYLPFSATVLEQMSSLLNTNIVKGPDKIVFHSEWDNFDKLLTGIHERPSVHTAAGIMLQEASDSHTTAVDSSQLSIPKTLP